MHTSAPPEAPSVPAPAAHNAIPPRPATPPKQLSDVSFASFVGKGLNERMLALIPYEFCSEVQALTLPPILAGKDVYVSLTRARACS
jgi:ATP-dependent RNA helicase MSS116